MVLFLSYLKFDWLIFYVKIFNSQ